MIFNKTFFSLTVLIIVVLLFTVGVIKRVGQDDHGYVLKIDSKIYTKKQFRKELEIKYKAKLEQEIITSRLLATEARKRGVSIKPTEVNARINYLIEQDELNSNFGDVDKPFVFNKVQQDILIEKLLELKSPTPEAGYLSYYNQNVAFYTETKYRLVYYSSMKEKNNDKVSEAWSKKIYDIDQIKVDPKDFKEVEVKESDLLEEERYLLNRTNSGHFVQYHAENKEIFILIKEKKISELPYRIVRQKVINDYGIERARVMRDSYINELKTHYNIVVNNGYFIE